MLTKARAVSQLYTQRQRRACLDAAVALSELSYRFIERPFLARKARLS